MAYTDRADIGGYMISILLITLLILFIIDWHRKHVKYRNYVEHVRWLVGKPDYSEIDIEWFWMDGWEAWDAADRIRGF